MVLSTLMRQTQVPTVDPGGKPAQVYPGDGAACGWSIQLLVTIRSVNPTWPDLPVF